jgi:hypothetical protein
MRLLPPKRAKKEKKELNILLWYRIMDHSSLTIQNK